MSFLWVWRCLSLFNLNQKLPQLLPLAFAKVDKADSHPARIVDCLGYAREAIRHPIGAKLDFDPTENPYRKWPVTTNATTAETDIDKLPLYIRSEVHETDNNA